MPKRLSRPVVAAADAAKIMGIRAGAKSDHKFVGVWPIVVDGRLFARSWTQSRGGWYRTFLEDPLGVIQVGDREVRVRAIPREERAAARQDRRRVRREVRHQGVAEVREGISHAPPPRYHHRIRPTLAPTPVARQADHRQLERERRGRDAGPWRQAEQGINRVRRGAGRYGNLAASVAAKADRAASC